MAYNTGNALGSGDARDFKDNAETLDRLINATAATTSDRLGNTRKTWTGIEQLTDTLQALIDADRSAAQLALTQVAVGVVQTQTLVVEHHAFT
jgi:hypothetical protein